MADNKFKRIIQPGDPEFQDSAKTIGELLKDGKIMRATDGDAVKAKFEERTFPHFHLSYALIALDEGFVRLVFHVKKLSMNKMKRLNVYLMQKITQDLRPQGHVEAGISPLADEFLEYRSQYDLIVSRVPVIYGKITLNAILKILEDFPG